MEPTCVTMRCMTQPTAEATGHGIPWPVFAVTVTGAFVVALDLSIVNVAFPSIKQSFPETSTAALSWVLSAYSVVFGALLLGAGRIADRSGRRGRAPPALFPCPAARRLAGRSAGGGGGVVGWHRRPRRRHRPVIGIAAHRKRRLAVGLLRQPPRCPGRGVDGSPDTGRVEGRRSASGHRRDPHDLGRGGLDRPLHHPGRRVGLDELAGP